MTSKRERAPRALRPREYMTIDRALELIEHARGDRRTYPTMDRAEAFATLVELVRLTEGRLYRPMEINLLRLALRFAPKPVKDA